MIKNKLYIHKPILFIVFILAITLMIPSVFSLTMKDTIQNFENTINLYDDNEISVAQLIILLENYMNENQEYLQENNLQGWSKQEAENALRKYKTDYGYVIDTHDLHIFLGIYETTPGFYGFGYSVGGKKYPKAHLDNQWKLDIETFKQELSIKYKNNNYDFSDLSQNWRDITGPAFHVSYQECVNYMSSFMDEVHKKNLPDYVSDVYYYPEPTSNSRIFFTTIYEETKSECMDECRLEEEVCDKICSSYPTKIGISGHCSKSEPYNFISLSRMSSTSSKPMEFMNGAISFFDSQPNIKECEPYDYDGRLYFRTKLQESVDNDFFDWYMNDFLGDDFEKYIKAGSGFRRIMGFLENTAHKISESLMCKGLDAWPNEFQRIHVDYKSENAQFEIWEDLESVRGFDIDMWTTYYKSSILPKKNIMKQLIKHQLSEQSSFGPPQHEIDKIKSQKEAMELIDKVTSGFGDSMDFGILLKDDDEIIINKYVSINEDVIVKISDDMLNEIDFTATVEFDDLYDFLERMSIIEFEQIKSPYWSTKRSPMMIGKRIGLIFDFWGAFSIEPFTTKVRLTTKLRNIVNFLQEMNGAKPSEKELIEELDEQLSQEVRNQDVQVINDESEHVASSESIIFKIETTYPTGAKLHEYKAINLNNDYPDFKLTGLQGDDSISIISGSQKTGWTYYYGEWMDMTRMESWDNLWESYYSQFEFAYSTILRKNKDEIVLNPEQGVTMRIYDIDMNPQISESEFNPN